jgi:hypothetical protein
MKEAIMKFSAALLLSFFLSAAAITPASAKQPVRSDTSPPKGSYQKTCKNIRLERDGRVLSALCRKWIGGDHYMWEETSLWLPCNKDIENRDGLLFCGPKSLRRR